jgi:uncharacterized membrane protein
MSKTTGWLFWILFSAGVAIRLIQFLHCRSLWCDEGHIALNLLNRSYIGLLQPLDYHQGAPLGFLWSTRLLMSLLGPNEFALRGYSLICGILILPVFYALARNLYDAKTALFVLALLAFMPSLIGYSNEAKQYMATFSGPASCFGPQNVPAARQSLCGG